MTDPIEEALRSRAEQVERRLTTLLPTATEGALGTMSAAIRHGTLSGGKRLRPFLVLESGAACGAEAEAGLTAACAIEMVHSYSLIHDDLPAMDDAATRRGRPSVHAAFGEAIGILTGDALLTDAFGVIAEGYDAAIVRPLVAVLATGAGSAGMVGGQAMDLFPGKGGETEVVDIQQRKTGALIEAACSMGGIVAGATTDQMAGLRSYAEALGLAFQIRDDLLDATADGTTLGKPAGQDEAAGKATFVSLYGLKGARERVAELTDAACEALDVLPQPETLRALARWQAARDR